MRITFNGGLDLFLFALLNVDSILQSLTGFEYRRLGSSDLDGLFRLARVSALRGLFSYKIIYNV